MGAYICVGMLAAFGLWCALWTVFGGLCMKEPGMVCICRPGSALETVLRRWNCLRSWNLLSGRLLVMDFNLTEQEKTDILRLGIEIEFCRPEDLPALLGMGAKEP